MARVSAVVVERRFKISLEVGKHLMLLGNLAAGALVFGQVVSGVPFRSEVALLGIVALVILYTGAVLLMRGGVK